MDNNDDEARCQALAYELWEAAGCPDGADHKYWMQARALLGRAGSPVDGSRPMNVDAGGVEAGEAENQTIAP